MPYLTEQLDPDSEETQVFLAPGEELANLVEGFSPWTFGHLVRIPARHWHQVLLAVAQIDPTLAGQLDRWSGTVWGEDGSFTVTAKDVEKVSTVFANMIENFRDGRLVSDEARNRLGIATREDYVRILEAFLAVIQTALREDRPFQAWIE